MRSEEVSPALIAAVQFFCILYGYFLLRPLRETFGVAQGLDTLRWLFIINVGVMLAVNIAYGALVARLGRERFLPIVYHTATACLVLFGVMLFWIPDSGSATVGAVFYVWLSVFNVFIVSVFWALLADVFSREQGKRLFGFIGVGGTAGAIAGSASAWTLAEHIGPVAMLAIAVLFVQVAAALAGMLSKRATPRTTSDPARHAPLGGASWEGLAGLVRRPLPFALAITVLLFTVLSTFLYFEKMRIVAAVVESDAGRTRFFAAVEFWGQTLTVLIQLFLTGRLMKLLGVGAMLSVVPLVTLAGFAVLAVEPTLGVIAVFEAVRRASNFSLSRPARETVYTVMSREDRYKAKAAIDTFVYRGGDVVGTLGHGALLAVPLAAAVSIAAVPLSLLGLAAAVWLGVASRRAADQQEQQSACRCPRGGEVLSAAEACAVCGRPSAVAMSGSMTPPQ